MAKSTLLIHEDLFYTPRFRVVVKVFEVEVSEKYPRGIKSKYVLIDFQENQVRLLVDNHEPFGFHMHTQLPHERDVRVKLNTEDHEVALRIFNKEAWRIIADEN